MVWVYLCCPKGHMYRIKKTKPISARVICPYCGSKWRYRTTKREWVVWRGWYYSLGLKCYDRP